jgi:hypothetical protein
MKLAFIGIGNVGYFDTNGDLIVEIYDDKSDKVTIEKYRAIKE